MPEDVKVKRHRVSGKVPLLNISDEQILKNLAKAGIKSSEGNPRYILGGAKTAGNDTIGSYSQVLKAMKIVPPDAYVPYKDLEDAVLKEWGWVKVKGSRFWLASENPEAYANLKGYLSLYGRVVFDWIIIIDISTGEVGSLDQDEIERAGGDIEKAFKDYLRISKTVRKPKKEEPPETPEVKESVRFLKKLSQE
jgi:hypothetical protein